MKQLRKQLDLVDLKIIKLLVRRQNISKRVGMYKQEQKILIRQPKRETEVLKSRATLGRKSGLHKDFVNKIFKTILSESRKAQK